MIFITMSASHPLPVKRVRARSQHKTGGGQRKTIHLELSILQQTRLKCLKITQISIHVSAIIRSERKGTVE